MGLAEIYGMLNHGGCCEAVEVEVPADAAPSGDCGAQRH
jgi:hypothetical protein